VNKQGRSEETLSLEDAGAVIATLEAGQKDAYAHYEAMLNKNLAREVARIGLPLSLYTEWYWQMDLNNLFHFLRLRLDEHAQWEIRQYAAIMADLTRRVAPLAYAAFEKYRLSAVSLSTESVEWLKERMPKDDDVPREIREKFKLK
jgi:thymidylate synthase (FAD)